MAVKFSEFAIGTINADLELVGFNSATPNNVQVSYNDIRDSILNLTLNIYNANGTLTSNRILSTAGNTIAFRTGGVDEFLFTPTNGSIAPIFKVYNVSFGGKLDLGYGYFQVGGGALSFGTNNSGNIDIFAGTQKAKIFGSTGNVLIQTGGTFTDAGYKLDVNGTVRIQNALQVNGISNLNYNDNAFNNGLFLRNSNTGTNAYTGIALQQANGDVKAGFQYLPSNFDFAPLRNTVIFASTSQSRLGFVANSASVGSIPQDIFFQTMSGINNLYIYGATGNVLIQNGGTFTDAGFRLDVNGTARVSGNTTIVGQLTTTSNFPTYRAFSTSATESCGYQCFTNNGAGNSSSFLMYGTGVGFGLGGNAGFGSNTSIILFASSASFNGGTNAIRLRPGGYDTSADALVAYQNSVSVGTTNIPVASAVLDVVSTNRGFLPPRMTTTQKNAIGTPAAGLQVYDTTLNQMSYYNGTTWVNF